MEERSAGERIADKIAAFVGSWPFVYIHVVWFGFWMLYPVEPFPYGFLTMLVSLEAIMLSTFIIMSQNREAKRDRRRAEADYETDLASKKEIEEVHKKLETISTFLQERR
jgi:uncharacterized membrane protein